MQNKRKPSLLSQRKVSIDSLSLRHAQNGATLIVVLVILILVTSIGIIAIKNSNTSLKISTAEQINDVKFRANDVALQKVEKEDRANTASAALDRLKGYVTSNKVKNGEEVIFCLKPNDENMFRLNEISVKREDGKIYSNRNNGFCDPSQPTHYMNEGRTLTQLTFVKQDSEAIFDKEAAGTYSNNLKVNGIDQPICSTIKGYITSLIPAVSSATNEQISNCLKQGYNENKAVNPITVDSCLVGIKVTHETQVQTYKVIPVGYRCV